MNDFNFLHTKKNNANRFYLPVLSVVQHLLQKKTYSGTVNVHVNIINPTYHSSLPGNNLSLICDNGIKKISPGEIKSGETFERIKSLKMK
ncbi:hypothetical protein FNT14_23675 [Salmonella enterica]|nr:hypothetical protein [Salmonella enterica]EHO6478585.1 hypothetical protein [Salmonella enterica]